MRSIARVWGAAVMALGVWGAGCSKHNTYSDDAATQNAAESQARDQVLAPVIGKYCGKMYLNKMGVDVDVVITLTRAEDNLHSPQSSDPTLTARVPKLAGTMEFPAFVAADLNGNKGNEAYPDIYSALGGTGAAAFDNGDYTPSTQQIYLPYSVPQHPQGEYGEIHGTFNNGDFSGTWNSNSYQAVGNFDVVPACPTGGSSS